MAARVPYRAQRRKYFQHAGFMHGSCAEIGMDRRFDFAHVIDQQVFQPRQRVAARCCIGHAIFRVTASHVGEHVAQGRRGDIKGGNGKMIRLTVFHKYASLGFGP